MTDCLCNIQQALNEVMIMREAVIQKILDKKAIAIVRGI